MVTKTCPIFAVILFFFLSACGASNTQTKTIDNDQLFDCPDNTIYQKQISVEDNYSRYSCVNPDGIITDGPLITFYLDTQKPFNKGQFKNGNLFGENFQWYADGSLQFFVQIGEEGIMNGWIIECDKNKNCAVTFFKDGFAHGNQYTFDSDNQLIKISFFVNYTNEINRELAAKDAPHYLGPFVEQAQQVKERAEKQAQKFYEKF